MPFLKFIYFKFTYIFKKKKSFKRPFMKVRSRSQVWEETIAERKKQH